MSASFEIDHIFIAEDAATDAVTARVCERLPGVPTTQIGANAGDPISELGAYSDKASGATEHFTLGKRILLLTRNRGGWLRACPGTSNHVCCNLWTVNPGEGCPLDCTYCYLQSYLKRNPTLKIYTNTDDLQQSIAEKLRAEPNRLFRIGTGEVIDSLVWDHLTDWSKDFVPLFAGLPNGVLELKTKSNNIANLLDLKNDHADHTVVSWSVNARQICERDEARTATLDERIEAAALVQDAGYRVGIHFDPIIHFKGWEEGYREAVQSVFKHLDVKRIAWVSVSTLRYRREMQKTMLERFPSSKIPFGEQFLARDGKMRYIQPLRFKLVRHVWNEIKAIYPEMPTYMCMESSAAWREISGGPPVAGQELSEVFTRRGKLPVLQG